MKKEIERERIVGGGEGHSETLLRAGGEKREREKKQ